MPASAAPMIQRSRREVEEGALIERGSISVMNARDESGLVRIRKIHLVDRDRPFPGRSALGFLEDEPGAVIDGDLFRIARDRILDRLERDSEVVAEAGGALQ